jgi:hypothetical protein
MRPNCIKKKINIHWNVQIACQGSVGSVRIACHVLEMYVRNTCQKVMRLSEFSKIAMCLVNLAFILFFEVFKI